MYSVSPDPDEVGSALTWSTACLMADEFFLLQDDGKRIVVARFAMGDGYPTRPDYPTTATYYYEHQGKRLVWQHVSAVNEDLNEAIWKLWHQALAGWKIRDEAMGDVLRQIEVEGKKQGLSEKERGHQVYQGLARFVSTCKGVNGVALSNMKMAGLTKIIVFKDGEPFKPTQKDTN
jgi:hypothetical protein